MINEDIINTIKNKVDIVEVISEYIALTPKGKNYFGICPFHEDHSPSMSVNKEKQIYKCFSCGASGNVFTFVMNYENISFLEAVKLLGEKCGIKINSHIENKKDEKYHELYEIYKTSVMFYKNNLYSKYGSNAKIYLLNRKLNEETIKYFDIGLSLEAGNDLYKLLHNKFKDTVLINLGLINNYNSNFTDLYKNRIMFPIKDNYGNFVGFSGRIYNNEDNSKYINTKETIIFKKSEILYNYKNALEFIKLKKEIIICEGFMDVIRLHMIGIKNAVALMGTSFTDAHMEIIKKLKVNVVLCLDKDEAGMVATYKIGKLLINKDIKTFVINFSNVKDVDEYVIKFGSDSFKNCYNNKEDFINFELEYIKSNNNLDNDIGLSKYINQAIEIIKNIDDEILKEIKINEISKTYNIDSSIIKNKAKNKINIKKINKKEKQIIKLDKVRISELRIVYLMMNNDEIIDKFIEDLGYLKSEDLRELSNEIVSFKNKTGYFILSDFISYIICNQKSYETFKIVNDYNKIESYTNEEVEDYINIIKKDMVNNQIDDLKKHLKESMDIEEKKRIMKKIENIKKEVLQW